MEEKELYIAYLQILKNNLNILKLNNNQLLAIYKKINQFYQQDKKENIIEYNEITIRKLLNYAREKSRYPIINSCLTYIEKSLFEPQKENYLDTQDLFLANNLESIYKLLKEDRKTYINKKQLINEPIPTIKESEYENIIQNILIEIDPTRKWLSYYEELDCMDKIIYIDELTKEEKNNLSKKLGINVERLNNCCLELGNEIYIILTSKKNLSLIPSLLHEFAHAISFNSKEETIGKTTSEYPSIFYELYAINYLEKIGYPKKEINNITNERYNYTIKIGNPILLILKYLVLYHQNNELTPESAITQQKEKIQEVIELEKTNPGLIAFLKQEDPSFFDAKTKVKHEIDTCIINILSSTSLAFYESYKYLIGFYLAKKAKEKNNLKMIKYHTEHLKEIEAFTVFQDLNINIKQLNIQKIKQRKKKENE